MTGLVEDWQAWAKRARSTLRARWSNYQVKNTGARRGTRIQAWIPKQLNTHRQDSNTARNESPVKYEWSYLSTMIIAYWHWTRKIALTCARFLAVTRPPTWKVLTENPGKQKGYAQHLTNWLVYSSYFTNPHTPVVRNEANSRRSVTSKYRLVWLFGLVRRTNTGDGAG